MTFGGETITYVRICKAAAIKKDKIECRAKGHDGFTLVNADDTHDRGRTLRLRASSSSSESEADRHVRFVSAGTE